MKVFSLVRHGLEYIPVEVEISFLPGLPQLHFLGRADSSLKESQLRIKSALRHQGFEWPQAKQIIVNLRPQNIIKSSQGLDLAIACAYLWKSGQVSYPFAKGETPWIYGDLNLEGKVLPPSDIESLAMQRTPFLTGPCQMSLPFSSLSLEELRDLKCPESWVEQLPQFQKLSRPELSELSFCKISGELLKICATGEHNILLAGPAGSGKSTFVEVLPSLLKAPEPQVEREIKKWSQWMNREVNWRPIASPHHTIPLISMVGGGFPLKPGEVTAAHGGVLILDELLEYSKAVKEALREPIQTGQITVSRRGESRQFPAKFMLAATSNLCPCGDLVPGKISGCRFSLGRCQSYLEKLSGPLADRFAVLGYTHTWSQKHEVSLQQILAEVVRAQEFAQQVRGQKSRVNAELEIPEIEMGLSKYLREGGLPQVLGSRRRYKSFLQVARTCADLEQSSEITVHHADKALSLSYLPFRQLSRIFA